MKKLRFSNRARCRLCSILAWLGLVISTLPAAAKPFGLEQRPMAGPFLNGALPEVAPAISGNWTAVVAFPNLLFTNAAGLVSIPGTDQLCVWEREGRAWSFQNAPGAGEKKLILDLSQQCQGWDDSGLLGIAFHPGFVTNHFLFVYYTWVKPGTVMGSPTARPVPNLPDTYHDRLERYTVDANGVALPDSAAIFVDLTNQTVWHHGGGMFFHPHNGFLYWTDGDNSVGENNQIITNNLYSGVFRVDVDCRGGKVSHAPPRQPMRGATAHYFIPNDNPFAGQAGVLEEFFCLGLRSPHRMTYDEQSDRIFIGDVGESSREEIDVIGPGESGLNFQWNRCEGSLGKMEPPSLGASRRPLLDYPHDEGRAVIGGHVYRGKEFARDLGGKYIFGDNVSRTVWALDESATPVGKTLLCVMPKGTGPNSGTDYTGLSSFGTDAEGEIYFCQMSSIGGSIFKLRRGGPPPPAKVMPLLLSQTGAFADTARLRPADFLIPYSVNAPLWSDGALKTRWFAVPTNSAIGFSADGPWTFPAGSVFVKHFALAVDEPAPKNLRRLETRLLVRDTNGYVYGASYKWRADNSDADLVTNSITEDIPLQTAEGARVQRWFFPGRQDCLTCHSVASGGVLGVNTRQLNGEFTYVGSAGAPSGTDNQLRALGHLGLFDHEFAERKIGGYPRLASLGDIKAPLELRARSYFDANCSQCHRPGGVGAFFDTRFETRLPEQSLINGPVANQLGIAGAKVVAPGDLDRSMLYHRISIVGENQMPPLARNLMDTNALAVVGQWILSLHARGAELPRGWTAMDIGKVGMKGETSFLNGGFQILASGSDIWERADAFHFARRNWPGDGSIVARITALQYTDPWAKAGVMFRESDAESARYVFVGLTGQGGSVVQSRFQNGASTWSTDGPPVKPPCWIKLTRKGQVFTGYVSSDGTNWIATGSATNSLGKNIFAGLALTSHNNAVLNSTLFNNVSVR